MTGGVDRVQHPVLRGQAEVTIGARLRVQHVEDAPVAAPDGCGRGKVREAPAVGRPGKGNAGHGVRERAITQDPERGSGLGDWCDRRVGDGGHAAAAAQAAHALVRLAGEKKVGALVDGANGQRRSTVGAGRPVGPHEEPCAVDPDRVPAGEGPHRVAITVKDDDLARRIGEDGDMLAVRRPREDAHRPGQVVEDLLRPARQGYQGAGRRRRQRARLTRMTERPERERNGRQHKGRNHHGADHDRSAATGRPSRRATDDRACELARVDGARPRGRDGRSAACRFAARPPGRGAADQDAPRRQSRAMLAGAPEGPRGASARRRR